MFVHMSIHHVKPQAEGFLIDSMKRFGNAMKCFPGFRNAFVLKDQKSGNLVGMALWDSKEHMLAAVPAMQAAVVGDDFESWEFDEPQGFHLDTLYSVFPES